MSILVYARCLNIVFTYNFVYSNELEIEDTTDIRQATSYLNSVTLKPKGQSESVYRRRTDNTMAKRKKYKRTNNDLQNMHIKLKIE